MSAAPIAYRPTLTTTDARIRLASNTVPSTKAIAKARTLYPMFWKPAFASPIPAYAFQALNTATMTKKVLMTVTHVRRTIATLVWGGIFPRCTLNTLRQSNANFYE
jgi:hypothetical protein